MAYVPHTPGDRREMLEALGLRDIDGLFRSVPEEIRLDRPLDLPPGKTEPEILSDLGELASRNARMDNRPSFLGAGVYRRFIPVAIDALASRGEFSTAYTPYQPEVSQGTLQGIIEYQTMICQLTAMEISNASLYDGATALVEAVMMAYALRSRAKVALFSEGVHPEYLRVLETYFRHHPIELRRLPLSGGVTSPGAVESALRETGGEALAVVFQNPNFLGFVEDAKALGELLSGWNETERPLLISVVDPISLGVLHPPGAYGADVAVGDGQQLGNPPAYGGPTFGFFATRKEHVRKVPGRIVGETRDRDGRRGYVLTFQTREQHIRRERATSNICTNQGLCSLRAAMYLALLGKEGVQEVAEASTRRAHFAFRELTRIPGVEAVYDAPFFQEFPLRLPLNASEAYLKLAERGVGGGLALGRYFPDREREMLFAFTEMTTCADIQELTKALRVIATNVTERTTSLP